MRPCGDYLKYKMYGSLSLKYEVVTLLPVIKMASIGSVYPVLQSLTTSCRATDSVTLDKWSFTISHLTCQYSQSHPSCPPDLQSHDFISLEE